MEKTPLNKNTFKGAEDRAYCKLFRQILIVRSPCPEWPEWLDPQSRKFEGLDERHAMVQGLGEYFVPLLRDGVVAVCTQGIMHPTDWDNSRLDLTRLNPTVEFLRGELL